ncbi:hypothetical protein [Paramagnetospirillum marisnigri]|uniref:hypothetical protein n=1 Tax=Paramagnetospirillum marisnigri TaxID=1285242 RepID=UPI0009ED153C|nr:hypothetical protein [Paramagnetospirillum marisnigri]
MGSQAENEAQALPASADADADRLVEDSFTLALDAMLSDEDARFQTKLHVISLVEFREAVGAKWSRLSEKVMLIAEGVINHHIGPGNVYGRRGQDFFVLLFRTVPAAEGRRRAVLIAQDLGTRLVGAQFVGAERPLALAAEISLEEATAPHGVLNVEAIQGAVGEVRAIMAPEAERRGYRPHLTKMPTDEDLSIHHSALPAPIPESHDLRAHLRPSKLQARDFTPRRSMLPSNPAPAKAEEPQKVAAPSWTAVDMAAAKPGTAADPGLNAAPPMPGNAALSLAWRPTWMAEPETIGAYVAQVQRVDAPGETAFEGCRAYPPGGGDSALALDRFTIGAMVREARSPETARSGAAIVIPVHWASVSSPQRMTVLAPFADLSEEMRANRLIIDLFGIPDGLGEAPLAAMIQSLRPMCRDVWLRVRLGFPRLTLAKSAGTRMIGIELGELSPEQRTDDAGLLDALATLNRDAADMGLNSYAWGIRRRAVVTGAVAAGLAMINGPGLMKDLPRPSKVLPAPRSRLTGSAS